VRYAKAFLFALPLWLVLLVLFPHWGLTEASSFLGASIIASGVAIGGARMFRPGRPTDAAAGAAAPRRINPPGRMTLVVLTLVIVLYVVLVLRAGG
jgi:hypothetical protein